MQPDANEFSVSRRALDVEDYIDIVRRHKAWILGPSFLGLVIAVLVAFVWPDTYLSEAVIRVVPPVVPERYIPANINMAMDQRVNSMAQVILSKTSLTNIIQTYNLYRDKLNRLPMEDVVEEMKTSIRIGNVYNVQRGQPMSAFQISFAYNNKYLAQKVASDLAGRFIDENIRTRSSQSVLTTSFLKDQLDQAKKVLDDREQKLAAFRAKNSGRLPDQLDASMQRLNAVESQIGSANSSINRATQEKMLLESKLDGLKKQAAGIVTTVPSSEQAVTQRETNQRIAQLERDIQGMELGLTQLRERWTDNHPDVVQMKARIQTLRNSLADLKKQEDEREKERAKERESEAKTAAAQPRRVDPAAQKELQNIQGQLDQTVALLRAKDMEIEELQQEQRRLESLAKERRAVVNANPINEGQYTILVQDRDLARKRYDELNSMHEQSNVATEVENRKQGETLELLDAASLPQTPTAPKRWLIVCVGVMLGVMAGLSLAGAREMRDTSLKNLKDVRAYTQLSILASVPLLENDLVVRRRRRLNWLAWSTACLIGIAVMGGAVMFYMSTKG